MDVTASRSTSFGRSGTWFPTIKSRRTNENRGVQKDQAWFSARKTRRSGYRTGEDPSVCVSRPVRRGDLVTGAATRAQTFEADRPTQPDRALRLRNPSGDQRVSQKHGDGHRTDAARHR